MAWLSLDDEDDDPGRFFMYLVAALRRIHPHIGATTLASLQAPQLPRMPANNIYGKVGVASRTQAIARGCELGLLTD